MAYIKLYWSLAVAANVKLEVTVRGASPRVDGQYTDRLLSFCCCGHCHAEGSKIAQSEMSVRKTFIIIVIYPLTWRVVGAPQIILQPVFSIFPCSLLPSGTCRTPGLSIP